MARLAAYRDGGRDAHELRDPVDQPCVSCLARAPARHRFCSIASDAVGDGRVRARGTRTSSSAGRGDRRRSRRDPRRRPRPRAPAAARERLRAHPRAGDPARRGPSPPPRRRRRGPALRAASTRVSRGRAIAGRRSRTGRSRPRARHNWLYWTRGSTRASGAPRTATSRARGRGTCAPPSATSRPVAKRRASRGRPEALDAATTAVRGALRCCSGRVEGVPATPSTTSTRSGDLVERRGDRLVLTLRGRLLANQVRDPAARGSRRCPTGSVSPDGPDASDPSLSTRS